MIDFGWIFGIVFMFFNRCRIFEIGGREWKVNNINIMVGWFCNLNDFLVIIWGVFDVNF